MRLLPFVVSRIACVRHRLQLLCTRFVHCLHLGEDNERIGCVAAQVRYCGSEVCARLAQRLPVRGAFAFEVRPFCGQAAFAHRGVPDDERRALSLGFGIAQCLTDGIGVVACNLLHIPVPCTVFGCYILRRDGIAVGRELHIVRVVEHNEIIQPQVPCYAPCALRNLLLDTAVGDEGIDGGIVHFAETSVEPFRCNRCTHGEGMSLPQRAAGILYPACDITLRVSGGNTAPLAQLLQVVQREEPC